MSHGWGEPEPEWDDHVPLLRRPGFRMAVTLIATGALAGVTVLSTCAPGRTRAPATTTTPGVQAVVAPAAGA